MSLKALAESVILQSAEDLWDIKYREQSIAFFLSNDFFYYADICRMGIEDKKKLLRLVHRIYKHVKTNNIKRKSDNAEIFKTIFMDFLEKRI